LSGAKFLSIPCSFPDLRDDRLLNGAVRYTVECQLRALETQKEHGAFVHRLIEFGQQLLHRVQTVPPYHGIMWALNAYWRARERGPDLLLEFETITLARSVETFACKVGFIPVPRAVVVGAMNSLPAESVAIILEGTRAECAQRAALRAGGGR
jgi:hypothetical protein